MPIPGNLLNTDMDILSLDVFTNGEIFSSYAKSILRFLKRDGILVWGIVPTGFEDFSKSTLDTLGKQLENIWDRLAAKGIDLDMILHQSMLSPATCCLINPDKEKTVEKAFVLINELSQFLRKKYRFF
jgi:hypothetical protein